MSTLEIDAVWAAAKFFVCFITVDSRYEVVGQGVKLMIQLLRLIMNVVIKRTVRATSI
jgi:hypothetical protein